jgi:cysteinyl-tRNA synthetase
VIYFNYFGIIKIMIKLYNTLTRKKQNFKPSKKVGFYSCGPTVYNYAHIGNLRTYLFNDTLKRVLEYNDYKVKHVMNLTDVGHLTSDADTGEDKLEKAASKENKTAWEIASFYADAFKKDLIALNIIEPGVWAKATDHIKEQITIIKKLKSKGFAYKINDGIYFDTSKIKDYGKLAGTKKRTLKAGARVEMVEGKKNISDFALWKFSPKDSKRQMEWNSPWGIGFPGWHTECIAMAKKYLGIPFDIHTGGVDLIPTHHTNEIAQAKAAFGLDLAKFWLHGEHLLLKEGKMAKSDGNIILIKNIIEKNINPLAFRYLCLTAHYRSKLTFSWESLEASQIALNKISNFQCPISNKKEKKYKKEFLKIINDDLDTPRALAFIWKLAKENKLSRELLLDFDKVLGLGLGITKTIEIPEEIKELAQKREECRKAKNFQEADRIRKEIEAKGFSIEDTPEGPKVK